MYMLWLMLVLRGYLVMLHTNDNCGALKVLICAPRNVAVDKLTEKISAPGLKICKYRSIYILKMLWREVVWREVLEHISQRFGTHKKKSATPMTRSMNTEQMGNFTRCVGFTIVYFSKLVNIIYFL